ncbi:MAG TPA: trigger factor [Flavobacteriales bacterium]|nr:trigger factor [Flavobacteriales bacterium]
MSTMNITKESIDNLNARVTIKLAPADYQPQVEKTLKEQARKANMPGFRPGKVPVGVVKKMYGPSILVDEVNKMLGNKLYEYIETEKLEILGNPLPSEEVKPVADFENPADMEFTYDLGLAPKIDLDLGKNFKFDLFKIEATDKDIESSLENISQRTGEMVEHDTIADNDLVKVQWVELNEDGSIKESGILNSSSVALDKLNADLKKQLIGKKLEESLTVDYRSFSENDTDLAAMLAVTTDELQNVNSNFKITVEKIQRLKPAELNEETFKKMYPDGSVTNVDEMKEKIKVDYAAYFNQESDKKLKNDMVINLLKNTKVELPDEFLKRWLTTVGEKKSTKEQVEQEYPNYRDGLKWQLIQNKIIREKDIKVDMAELKAGIRAQLLQQFAQYGMQQADDEMMDDMVEKFMKREDEVRRMNDQLYDQKVMDLFRSMATLNEKKVTSEKFYEMASQENS